jgi:hypothetical protein
METPLAALMLVAGIALFGYDADVLVRGAETLAQ